MVCGTPRNFFLIFQNQQCRIRSEVKINFLGFAPSSTNRTRWLEEKNLRVEDLNDTPKRLHNDDSDLDLVASCCRNEQAEPEMSWKLKCRFEDRGEAYLKLGPFKVEEVALNPKIHLFHRVLSDEECDRLARFPPLPVSQNEEV